MGVLKRFTKVNEDSGTPRLTIVFVGVAVVVFALIGDLKTVASLSNIFVFALFILVNVALIRYRVKYARDAEKPVFKVPLNIGMVPVPTILALVGLMLLFGFNVKNLVS
jgi:APA family basic amino acid/polyamine antiporter